jgi:outer membrane biosynthesis protein TonB
MRSLNLALSLRMAGAGLSALLWALASADPAAGGQQPLLSQQSPNYQPPNYQQPPPNYQQPPPNYQPPPPDYQQPPPNYQQPPSNYQQPPSNYQQPPPNYQQPPPNYQPPPPNYQQPPPNYQQPPPNYQQAPPNYPQPAPNYQPQPNYAPSAGGEPPVAAVWTPKELRFTFMGFTAKYSCDGLQERIRGVLLKLGARPDLQVSQGPCAAPLGTPTIFPAVTIKMNVLQPASSVNPVNGGTPPQVVPAHWKRVDLTGGNDAVKEAGDCEVIEQIKQSILPQFTTRNVDYKSTCVPHQLTLGGTQLRADVLVADEPGAKVANTSPAR